MGFGNFIGTQNKKNTKIKINFCDELTLMSIDDEGEYK